MLIKPGPDVSFVFISLGTLCTTLTIFVFLFILTYLIFSLALSYGM